MGEVGNKYGVPLYGASWVPAGAVNSILKDDDDGDHQPSADSHIVLAGGGGEGSSGIRNDLLIVKFDSHSNSFSDQPTARLETGKELPYRIALHPGQDGLICSFPESCRWYEWGVAESGDVLSLELKLSERSLNDLEGVGQQLALAFNSEGSLLATGSEEGKLRIFKWPSMEIILSEDKAHTSSVKNLDFSLDGKFLATVGSGPARVWDLTSLTAVSSLPRENGEIFCFCKFSGSRDDNQALFVVAMQDQGANVLKWSTTSWMKISSKRVVRDPVSAFDVSPDGNLLALGTIEGDLLVLSSKTMKMRTLVKKAHLGLITALSFSHDSRYLVSASMDSSSRVTEIKDEKRTTSKRWMIFLILLFAIVAYIFQDKDLFQQVLDYQHTVLLKAGIA